MVAWTFSEVKNESFSKNMPCGSNTNNSPELGLENSNSALLYVWWLLGYRFSHFHSYKVGGFPGFCQFGKEGGIKTSLNTAALHLLPGSSVFLKYTPLGLFQVGMKHLRLIWPFLLVGWLIAVMEEQIFGVMAVLYPTGISNDWHFYCDLSPV